MKNKVLMFAALILLTGSYISYAQTIYVTITQTASTYYVNNTYTFHAVVNGPMDSYLWDAQGNEVVSSSATMVWTPAETRSL
jgi:hypothetical protein